MSAILASIADAERLAGYDPDCTLIDGTCARATAARAEHAEMVKLIEECRTFVVAWSSSYAYNHALPATHPIHAETLEKIRTLLSRVGGGA